MHIWLSNMQARTFPWKIPSDLVLSPAFIHLLEVDPHQKTEHCSATAQKGFDSGQSILFEEGWSEAIAPIISQGDKILFTDQAVREKQRTSPMVQRKIGPVTHTQKKRKKKKKKVTLLWGRKKETSY